MGYFRHLIRKSGVMFNSEETARNNASAPFVQDISINEERTAPVFSVSEADPAGQSPTYAMEEPDMVMNKTKSNSDPVSMKTSGILSPEQQPDENNQEAIIGSFRKEQTEKGKAGDGFHNTTHSVQIERPEHAGHIQKNARNIKNQSMDEGIRFEEFITPGRRVNDSQQPGLQEKKNISENEESGKIYINNRWVKADDKKIIADYAFEQVSNWVAGRDEKNEQHEEIRLTDTGFSKNQTAADMDFAAERTSVSVVSAQNSYAGQPKVQSMEQDIHLSIGRINVIVESPAQTTVKAQEKKPESSARKKTAEPDFLNWQRYYFNS